MNKIFLFLALLTGQIASTEAFDIEGRIAYYLPVDHRIRDIYGDHGYPEYELEVSCPINAFTNFCGCDCDPDWSVWGNFSIFHENGHSRGCIKDKSDITNWTLNFGVKRYLNILCLSYLRPYIGLGIGYANVHIHDHSDSFKHHIKQSGFALLAKSGVEFDITCNIYLNAFADFASNWFDRPHSECSGTTNKCNTGGLKLGLGFGYHF